MKILWDYISPKGDHYLEWQTPNGRTHMKIVSDEQYEALTAKPEADLDDFLN